MTIEHLDLFETPVVIRGSRAARQYARNHGGLPVVAWKNNDVLIGETAGVLGAVTGLTGVQVWNRILPRYEEHEDPRRDIRDKSGFQYDWVTHEVLHRWFLWEPPVSFHREFREIHIEDNRFVHRETLARSIADVWRFFQNQPKAVPLIRRAVKVVIAKYPTPDIDPGVRVRMLSWLPDAEADAIRSRIRVPRDPVYTKRAKKVIL